MDLYWGQRRQAGNFVQGESGSQRSCWGTLFSDEKYRVRVEKSTRKRCSMYTHRTPALRFSRPQPRLACIHTATIAASLGPHLTFCEDVGLCYCARTRVCIIETARAHTATTRTRSQWLHRDLDTPRWPRDVFRVPPPHSLEPRACASSHVLRQWR